MRKGKLTPKEWDKLGGKAKWDIMVALRGPDWDGGVASYMIKYYSTSVIRGVMEDVIRVGGLINQTPVIVKFSPNNLNFGQFDYSHFIEHVTEAASWLNVKIVKYPEEITAEHLLRNHYLISDFQQKEYTKLDSNPIDSDE